MCVARIVKGRQRTQFSVSLITCRAFSQGLGMCYVDSDFADILVDLYCYDCGLGFFSQDLPN